MIELQVKYIIDDKTEAKLKRVQELYKARGLDLTIEEMFNNLMIMGSKADIMKRLDYTEHVLTIK